MNKQKEAAWAEAQEKFRLSNETVRMAKELGMNSKKLGGIANHKQESWKASLHIFIQDLYDKMQDTTKKNKAKKKKLAAEKVETILIRLAKKSDAQIIFDMIKELAHYEKMEDLVVGTVEDIRKTLFCPHPKAEVLLVEHYGEPVAFALYFHNYSTFLCRHGIYIEDIYVREKYRGQGHGKALLQRIAQEAVKRNCGRIEWWCLDWNKPSIDFYIGLGAEPMSDWTVYRLNREQIEQMAA